MKKTILISGSKGFLASHLYYLLKDKYTVFGIAKEAGNNDGMTVFSSREIESIELKPDYVILCHAAISSGQIAASTDELFHVNVKITDQLVQKFNAASFIYISSASIYDVNNAVISEESTIAPQSEYAVSKLWAEQIVLKIPNAVVVRLSSLFGIGMKENTIIPNYIQQAITKNEIQVWGKGAREQNYIHVDDAASCIHQVIDYFELVNHKILLGVHSTSYSNAFLAQIIAEKTDARINFVNEDHSKSWHYNNSITQKLLNWSPKIDFRESIYNYIQWKKEQF